MKPTWKNTLYQQNKWYGSLANIIKAAEKADYTFVCFNGQVFKVDSCQLTGYTVEDLDRQLGETND